MEAPEHPHGPINHWCRIVMNRATTSHVEALDPGSLDVLEISGSAWSDFGFRTYEAVDYPAFDISRERTGRSYDLIIAEQVFEHLRYPADAARNVLGMLRVGGTFVITTPFLIRVHPSPLDLWRWTADGLHAFLEDAGFDEVKAASWGNRDCVSGNFDDWPYYDAEEHSLESEADFPVVVWAIAKKTRRSSRFRPFRSGRSRPI
jgi:SAM-dependent methyltransferase